MNRSFNIKLKMTALSVIFFIALCACSTVTHSKIKPELDSSDKNIEIMDSSKILYCRGETMSPVIINPANQKTGLIVCDNKPSTFHKSFILKQETSLVNHYQYMMPPYANITQPAPQEIFNIVKIPESGPEWFSISISILALIFSVGLPYYQHKRERKEAINEGYWIREVIMPKINDLAFDVTAEFKEKIKLPEDDFLISLDETLFPKLGESRDSFYLLEGLTSLKSDIDTLDEVCDELEANMSNNIHESDAIRASDITKFHSTLTQKLIKIHLGVG